MVQIWIPRLYKSGPIRDRGGHFLYIRGLLVSLPEHSFQFLWRLHFLSLQSFYLNEVCPFTVTPDGGLLFEFSGNNLLLTAVTPDDRVDMQTEKPVKSFGDDPGKK